MYFILEPVGTSLVAMPEMREFSMSPEMQNLGMATRQSILSVAVATRLRTLILHMNDA